MKTRKGFVSNSSSSSFVIERRYLSPWQIEQILNHSGSGLLHADTDPWKILDTEYDIGGFTGMDNFDMLSFLEGIGIKKCHIKDLYQTEDCHELPKIKCAKNLIRKRLESLILTAEGAQWDHAEILEIYNRGITSLISEMDDWF